ncbi:MAG: sensor histidine kinase [Proteobacteria bacterium]|nr:sensor histidine kinase [Pseudomonadota bacterium]MBS0573904.1 sensor histidine kinase [Pseudomonadota bacterium]
MAEDTQQSRTVTAPARPAREAQPSGAAGAGRLPLPHLLTRLWPRRVLLAGLLIAAVAVLWATNSFLTERFTESTRNRAEVRQALYTGQLLSELQRTSVVPLLLARDPELISALTENRFATTSLRLISAQADIGASAIQLLDMSGRVVAATDRTRLGQSMRNNEGFLQAQRSSITVFSAVRQDNGDYEFAFSRPVYADSRMVGVIMVEVQLGQFEKAWATESDAVAITDSTGHIILATEPRWRGLTMEEALAVRSAPSAIQRAIQATTDWASRTPDAYVQGVGVMRSEMRIPFRGWRLVTFTTYDSIRDRVNAVLALEIMGFALLVAAIFYALSRRARSETANVRRESAELRLLNARLQREIAEREKAQKDLAVAEQTLAQSSKLAALGEMSASVSHELNQPLAAMKTYLAGARLLLQRKRPEEAMSSFQRIDDLIERMGAITRQLKSYARKGGEAFEPIDVRSCVSGALSMMEPTLRTRSVKITRTLPRLPVMIMADRIRMEQVIINLLRNALDATRDTPAPQIDLLLTSGEKAILSVRDNGHGIVDLDSLFEPFYTTKKPGDGVGLGLAISSGIVNDLGGRLRARNASPDGTTGSGAVFEVELPLLSEKTRAAE